MEIGEVMSTAMLLGSWKDKQVLALFLSHSGIDEAATKARLCLWAQLHPPTARVIFVEHQSDYVTLLPKTLNDSHHLPDKI